MNQGAADVLPDLPCACATVRRAARLVTQFYGDHLRGSGLEASQFTLLSALAQRPGSRQVVLGRALGMDKTTLSRNFNLLRKKGWVEMVGQHEKSLFLTREGQEIVDRANPGWKKAQEQLRGAMTAAEWQAMWKAMRVLTNAARSATGH